METTHKRWNSVGGAGMKKIKIGDYVRYVGTEDDGRILGADYDKIRYGQVRKVVAIDYFGNTGNIGVWLEGLSQVGWAFRESQFEVVSPFKYGDKVKVWDDSDQSAREFIFVAYVPEHEFPYLVICSRDEAVCLAYKHAELIEKPTEIEKLKTKYKELGEEIKKLEKG